MTPAQRRAFLWRRALALALVLVLVAALGIGANRPAGALAATAAAEAPARGGGGNASVDTGNAGSFRLGTVRILGVPVITVASPAVDAGSGTGPEAAERARVIEGNLSQLYEPRNPCTPGERLGEALLDHLSLEGTTAACDPNHLGLQGRPEALRVVVLQEPGGDRRLAAVVPGRASPFPLLTVTEQDAQFNGLTAEALAKRWRGLLERRLRSARRVFGEEQINDRLRISLVCLTVLALLMAVVVVLWQRSHRLLPRLQRRCAEGAGRLDPLALQATQAFSRLLAALVLLLGVAMGAVLLLAWPGQIPAAIDVLMQPLVVLMKALLLLALAAVLRGLVGLLLTQWASHPAVRSDHRARRRQRYLSLLRVLRRLVNLACLLLFALWTVRGIPVLRDLSTNAVLASGAVLGALALVFQGLLRDFVAGLVLLLDDRYAIGDWVEITGRTGEVVDVGVLSTELRAADQRVVVVPNSHCEQVVNHTKLRSGAEVTLLLSRSLTDLGGAMAVIAEELAAFGNDPHWAASLLEPPRLLGLEAMTADDLQVKALLITQAGRQGEARRALLGRLVERLQGWPQQPGEPQESAF
ncbi:MscS family mechanosensitive ion channel [Cyanobium sp. Copco_Reservoir_LC18]|uniref:mechanosensitive ion channel family protein n=1 Tax=Cyanobium sp. Copco_Reservoir_LC18 TaxID=1328305 RepID=UPI00135CE57E|nr:mechanosensitive ion channel domain-containing protein [Cyanobium sp. Copco_Reservoir_LC18]KAF0654230.1 MscS family mechanosensitive ion channel [Cyanobium sp. Copco_Reservoir_LC18]